MTRVAIIGSSKNNKSKNYQLDDAKNTIKQEKREGQKT